MPQVANSTLSAVRTVGLRRVEIPLDLVDITAVKQRRSGAQKYFCRDINRIDKFVVLESRLLYFSLEWGAELIHLHRVEIALIPIRSKIIH